MMTSNARTTALVYVQEARKVGLKPESIYEIVPRETLPPKPSWRFLGIENAGHRHRLRKFYRENNLQDVECQYLFGTNVYVMRESPQPLWFFEASPTVGDMPRKNYGIDEHGDIHFVTVYLNGVVAKRPNSVAPPESVEWLLSSEASVRRLERLKKVGAEFDNDLMPFNPALFSGKVVKQAKKDQDSLMEAFREHQAKMAKILG